MAFNGYYLKINGTEYPVKYMVIPSYKPDNEPIITENYYDAAYDRHIVKAPKEDITIQFDLRSLNNSELPAAIAPFIDTMTVEYYDPKTNGYLTDTFTYTNNLTPQILRQYDSVIWYKELSIKLIRKAG